MSWWSAVIALVALSVWHGGAWSPAWSQTLAHKGWAGSGITVQGWWDGAVFYQIDPVSFQDSSDDGFGDLKGIVQRLDYLQALGVDAIVLSPFELQPEFARTKGGPPFDPAYGTEEDLDRLVEEAGRRKIRVLVDLPLNGSGSTEESANVARFWLSRGIAGLRLTASTLPGSPTPLTSLQIAERIRELRRVCASYAGQRVLLRDLPEVPAAQSLTHPSRRSRQRTSDAAPPATQSPAQSPHASAEGAQLVIDRRLALLSALSANGLRLALAARAGASGAVPVSVLDTADRPRSLDRYGDGTHDVLIAKDLAAILLTGPGTPLLYFGQEVGMATTPPPVAGADASAAYGGDTTPMQWGGEPGFTRGVPWIDMGRNAATANVALEDQNPDSLLNWYRKLSALRHENASIRNGSMELVAESNPDIVAWVRRTEVGGANAPAVLAVVNVTARAIVVSLASDLRRIGVAAESGGMLRTLASTAPPGNGAAGMTAANAIVLPPFGVFIGEVTGSGGLESAPAPARRASGRSRRSTRMR